MNKTDELIWAFRRWGFDERGWSEATRKTYYNRVLNANRWLEQNRGSSVRWAKPEDLKAFLASCTPDPRTRNGYRAGLIAFGEFLISIGYAEINQAKTLNRVREPRSLPKALDPEESRRVIALASALHPMKRAAVMVMIYGGLRLGEVRNLVWSNVDLHAGWFRFTGKGRKEREVPIHKIALNALKELRKEHNNAEWVFPSSYGGTRCGPRNRPVSGRWIARQVTEIGEAIGRPDLHPHMLRHTCATQLLDTGADIRDVQEWLGHANVSTTGIYLKVRPARLKEAGERLHY